MKTNHLLCLLAALCTVCIVWLAIRWFSGEAQRPLPSPEVLVQQLESDSSPEQKVAAAKDLVRHGPAAREQVYMALEQHRLQEPRVVAPLLQSTMNNRDHRSLPTAVELLEHPDPLVRGRAGAAVQKIMGADFGFRANDPPERRVRAIATIKADILNSRDRIEQFYESER